MEQQDILQEEADILHPLAKLHWERCHTWKYITRPKHCAVLHDIVCVVGVGEYGSGDKLYISSTDLHSWTTTTFPYENIALTTYQSKFVALGGLNPSTGELTNKLWTSDNGRDWQPSLPPMPTKRYDTSAISTGTPQHLVVAGGRDSYGKYLDVVEVLVGEQWTTVEPLPEQCSNIKATLLDGNLYFMGGHGQGDSVFTCKCDSLITLCKETNNDCPTSSSLWSQFKAAGAYTIAASYGQRLISIDTYSTISAYSSNSQSWVKITSVRDVTKGYSGHTTATVLPTGELVVACEDGVFRIKLSD